MHPYLKSRRRVFFTDQGTMHSGESVLDDLQRQSRQRIFADAGWGVNPEDARPVREVVGSPKTYRGATDPRDYTGMRAGATRMTCGNRDLPGRLGTGAVEAPHTDNEDVGFEAGAGYTGPGRNLTTTQEDPGLLYSTTARGVAGLRNDGMGTARRPTADVLRRINDANKRLWSHDADKPEDDDDPNVDSHHIITDGNDGGVEYTHIKREPKEHVHNDTVDSSMPRRYPVLPGLHNNDATRAGATASHTRDVARVRIAAVQEANDRFWKR